MLTSDWSDAAVARLEQICAELQCKPSDMLNVMSNESNCRADAHNPNGDASGLIQFMPFILKNLGYAAGDAEFRKLSPYDQLPYVRRYFAPHTGKLINATAVYMATFMPALLDHASDPNFDIADKFHVRTWAYGPNRGFDADGNGEITTDELTAKLYSSSAYPRFIELCARVDGKPVLKDRGDVQAAVISLGYTSIIDYQTKNNLVVDDIVGPKTIASVTSALVASSTRTT